MFPDESTNGVVAARVAEFITQSLEQTHRCVALLGWCRFIRFQDLQNPIQHRSQLRKRLRFPANILRRLTTTTQHFANLGSRMMKLTGNLTNAHPVPMSQTNPTVIVHRQHP